MKMYYMNLGGIIVALEEPDTKNTLVRLDKEYSRFLLNKSDVCDFHITIQKIEQNLQPYSVVDLEPMIDFNKNIVEINHNFYRGRLDIANRKGEIFLPSEYSQIAMEYLLRVISSILAIIKGGFMIHGGGVIFHQMGLLFIGKSGAGKTTIVGMAPENALILNDDLNVILPHDNYWMIHSTPFTNTTQASPNNKRVSLNSIFFLHQATMNRITPESPGVAFAKIVANIPLLDKYPPYIDILLKRVKMLIKSCGIYKLEFQKDKRIWDEIELSTIVNREIT